MENGLRSALTALSAAAFLCAVTALPAHAQVTETVLYSFLGGCDAASSYASVIADAQGTLYGTTGYGGASQNCLGNFGTVFKLTPPAHSQTAWTETVLWSFSGGQDGCYPYAELFATNKNPSAKKTLYGTTTGLGCGNGAVFKVTDGGLTTLWPFTGGPDGATPGAGLIADQKTGALYGTTNGQNASAASSNGTVFKIDPVDGTLTTIYTFSGNDGSSPTGRLLADGSGALYGTTGLGGTSGNGVVFKLTPPTRGQTVWTETVLYNFCSQPNCSDGAFPFTAGLIADKSGTLYGTTNLGGAAAAGVVFGLVPPAGGQTTWTETVLYNFCSQPNCSDGGFPSAPLIADRQGALYGTAGSFGINPFGGTVFKLTPPASGQAMWAETTLYQFSAGADGGSPYAGLIADNKGALYGTTVFGGTLNTSSCGVFGCGVVFKLTGAGFAPGEGQAED
jgi:uncharacterized repeat protein (TIGR03803 family)